MKNNIPQTSKNIHLVGIYGSGLSGLAGILAKLGKKITGSDTIPTLEAMRDFKKLGIEVNIGHKKENLPANTHLVIHSLAIPNSNPELVEARKRKIPALSYPEAVGALTQHFSTIAVSGTHGKTTITAMLAKILIENNFDPNVLVGASSKDLGNKNYTTGKSKLFVLEACEYKRAFLNYKPKIAIVHTLDPDHLDYYKNYADYLKAFKEFVCALPRDAYLFVNLDDEDIHEIIQTLQARKFPQYNIFTYSTKYSNSDFYLKESKILRKNNTVGELDLKIPGKHNKTNALCAFAVCAILGISPKDILKSLNKYTGAARRFELKGKLGHTLVIDDYGHHPVEIKTTLSAVREKFPNKKICVVFQPHQYSRTKFLFNQFAKAFTQASTVIIPNIYEARDSKEDKINITPEKLVAEIQKNNPDLKAIYGNGLKETAEFLKKHAENFDVIITMGAGDVWKIAETLIWKRHNQQSSTRFPD